MIICIELVVMQERFRFDITQNDLRLCYLRFNFPFRCFRVEDDVDGRFLIALPGPGSSLLDFFGRFTDLDFFIVR